MPRVFRHILSNGTLIINSKQSDVEFNFIAAGGEVFSAILPVGYFDRPHYPYTINLEKDIFSQEPEVMDGHQSVIVFLTNTTLRFFDPYYIMIPKQDMESKPDLSLEFKVISMDRRISELESELRKSRRQTDRLVSLLMGTSLSKTQSPPSIQSLLALNSGRNLGDLEADIGDLLETYDDSFEQFIAAGYDLRKIARAEKRIRDLVSSGKLAPDFIDYTKTISRILTLCSVDWSDNAVAAADKIDLYRVAEFIKSQGPTVPSKGCDPSRWKRWKSDTTKMIDDVRAKADQNFMRMRQSISAGKSQGGVAASR